MQGVKKIIQTQKYVKWYILIFLLKTKIWKFWGSVCMFSQFFDKNLFYFSLFWKEKIPYCIKYVIFAKRICKTYYYLYDDSLG